MAEHAAQSMPESAGTVLEHDHHAIDAHFARFGQGLAQGRVDVDALSAGAEGLRHHIYVEEEWHFPPLRAAGMLAPVLVMLREHGQIWDLLGALDEAVAADAPPDELAQTLTQLQTVLEAHNLKEERILYPAGDAQLPADVAERIRSELLDGTTPDGWAAQMATG